MAFIPTVDNTGKVVLGSSSQPLDLVGGMQFLASGITQSYSLSQTFSNNVFYDVTPKNWLAADIPLLIVGVLSLSASPWEIRFSFTYSNFQQNGDSRTASYFSAWCHYQSTAVQVGNNTSFYADGVAALRMGIWNPSVSFTLYGTWTTYVYRIGV